VLLVGSALFYASTYVPVSRAVEDLTPAAAVAIRFVVASLVFVPFAVREGRSGPLQPTDTRAEVRAAGLAGSVNTANLLLLSAGLQLTTASSSAFLTSLFVVFVPFLGALVDRRAPSRPVLAGVALAVLGSFLLTGATVEVGRGDLLSIGAAMAASVHILVIGRVASGVRFARFNAMQLAVVAALAGVVCLVVGLGELTAVAVGLALLTGLCQAGGMGLQVAAQRTVDPSSSALILLLIPIFGSLMGYVLSGDRFTPVNLVGAAVILLAVIIGEVLPGLRREPTGGTGAQSSARPRP
jgi:drug/metabolite transporter (DMT)-like permease